MEFHATEQAACESPRNMLIYEYIVEAVINGGTARKHFCYISCLKKRNAQLK